MNLLNGNGHKSTDSAVDSLVLEAERQRMNAIVGLTGQKNSPKTSEDNDQDDDALFVEDSSEVDQPFERTQSRFWEKGSSHVIFIGVAAALVMGLILSVYNSIAGGGGNTQTAKATDPAKKDDFFGSVPKDGTGDWKTQAALADQKAAMRNLNKPVVAVKVPPTVKPVTQQPAVRAAYVSPPPTIQSRVPEPVFTPPAPSFSPPSFVPPAPPISLDETQKKWEALGKLASWGAEDNGVGYGSAQGAYAPAISNSPIPQAQLVTNPQPLAPAPDESSVFSGVARKTVAIGTRVSGKLETPIVASPSQSAGDLFVVSLKQPLMATDGSTVLPQGAQIIVKVNGVSGGGLMRVSAVSASSTNGEVPLPQGAIEIRGENGRPLIAQNLNKPKGNGFLKNLALFGIGGLSRGAQLFNQPLSSVAALNGSSTIITNTNPAPNYFAGMLEGGTSSVLPGIQNSLQSTGINGNVQEPLWAIRPNTNIEIFVNQTVSL